MTRQIENHNLRTRLAKPQRQIGQILGTRSPAMNHQDPMPILAHGLCRQKVGRGHPARQRKPHRLRLPQPIASDHEDLFRLGAFRSSARRPTEKLERDATGKGR